MRTRTLARAPLALALAIAVWTSACQRPTGAGEREATAPAATASAPSAAPTALPPIDAAALWTKYCALCHAADATGYAADNAPSLVTETFLASATDDFLRESIARGRPGTAMAGYAQRVGGPLDDREINALAVWIRAQRPTERVTLYPPGAGDAKKGEAIYAQQCQSCHGTTAQRGDAVHLANPVFLQLASDAFIRYAIVNGRPGTRMASFAAVLDGAATNDVVAYLRSLSSLNSTHPPMAVTAAPVQVPDWRALPLNPEGAHPKFTQRDGRFTPMAEIAQALKEKKRLIIVDARAPSDFVALHIEGAVSLPYYDLSLIDKLPKDDGTWIVAYCGCPHHASGVVVDALRQRGYKNTTVLDEGLFAWQRAQYPIVALPGMEGIAAPPHSHTHHGHGHGHDHHGHGHDHHRHGHAPH